MNGSKILKFFLAFLLIFFIAFTLLIFALNSTLVFRYSLVSISIFILLATLYWIRYSHLKSFKYLLLSFAFIIMSYISSNLYIMATKIYLDASGVIWMNGKVMTKNDREHFASLLISLNSHHAYVKSEPTYSISFSERGYPDPSHLHIFRDKGLIYEGCLLGLENGLYLKGYQLTKEADKLLQEFDETYSP